MTSCHSRQELEQLADDFFRDGYVVVPGALDPATVHEVEAACDRIVAHGSPVGYLEGREGKREYRGLVARDPVFRRLLAHPWTFPLITKVLGPNIHLLQSHLIYLLPQPGVGKPVEPGAWHRDVLGVSGDLGEVRVPRMSLRVGYYLNDLRQPGTGAIMLVPGSHRIDGRLPMAPGTNQPLDRVDRPALAPGDAVIWENRVYHAAEDNTGEQIRKAVMFQYGFRWICPVDYPTLPDEAVAGCAPIERQLVSSSDVGPSGAIVKMQGNLPLRAWCEEHEIDFVPGR